MRIFGTKDLRLPDGMREEMRGIVGEIVQTADLKHALSGARFVVSVGDVCTDTILRLGIVPKVAIIDGMTKRGRWAGTVEEGGFRILRVKNPAKMITKELWVAIERAYVAGGSTLIIVEGEEDLASLACIFLAPEGTTVIYGVPNRGVMVIPAGAAIKERTGHVLAAMEE